MTAKLAYLGPEVCRSASREGEMRPVSGTGSNGLWVCYTQKPDFGVAVFPGCGSTYRKMVPGRGSPYIRGSDSPQGLSAGDRLKGETECVCRPTTERTSVSVSGMSLT